MTSTSSSDQIVFKKRRKLKQDEPLSDLFEESAPDSFSEEHYANQETFTIIQEVFGNGDEYDYIYEPKSSKTPTKSIEVEEVNEYYYESEDILYFLARRTTLSEFEKREIKQLISGDSVYFVGYHSECSFSIHELFDIKERLPEYLRVSKMVDNAGADMSKVLKFFENLSEAEEYKQYILQRNSDKYNELVNSKFVILPELLYENYINKQLIHEPEQKRPTSNFSEADFYVFYSHNLLFQKLVVNFYYDYSEQYKNEEDDFEALDTVKQAKVIDWSGVFYSVDDSIFDEHLFKYFRAYDFFDEQRKEFLKRCICKIPNFEDKMKEKSLLERKKRVKQELVDNVIDRIINGSIPIAESESCCGLFEMNGVFYCSVVNYKGSCINFYSEKSIEKIFERIASAESSKGASKDLRYIAYVCKEKGMKYNIKKLQTLMQTHTQTQGQGCNFSSTSLVSTECLIVDSLYDTANPRLYASGVAKRVLFPEIEVCKIYKSGKIPLFIKNQKLLNKEETMKCIKKAIQVSFSLIGINVNFLRFQEYKICYNFLDLSGNFDEILNEFGSVENLQSLENTILANQNTANNVNSFIIGNKINDYNNACCYLRVYNDKKGFDKDEHCKKDSMYDNDEHSKNNSVNITLDSLMVHPRNYKIANFICFAALKIESYKENNTEILYEVLKAPENLKNLDTEILQFENARLLKKIKMFILMHKRKVFEGVCDKTIFDELLKVSKRIYEGRIKKVNSKFIIVEIFEKNKKIDVFIKTNGDFYHINQILNVEITKPDYFNLSYFGSVKTVEKKVKLRFLEHPLCKFFDGFAAEKYLNDKLLVLRKSGKSDDAIISIRIDPRIRSDNQVSIQCTNTSQRLIIHHKLVERENDYLFENTPYDKIDEFISVYIRNLLTNIKNIKKHQKYCESEDEAVFNIENNKRNYSFYLSLKYPGKVVFIYKLNNTLKREYISVGMKLKYNEREFYNLDDFINFKKRQIQ